MLASEAPATATATSRRRATGADRRAVALLLLVPLALALPFPLTGRTMLPGDDLTQNYPLRVLAGDVLRSGHLPGWDPFLWSGTPLLAGWNAGAMFPGTWLFAVLPGSWAWAANLAAVGALAGVGTYVLLRVLGCRELPSLLAALVFTYTGFMSGQVVHVGLVEGTACMPWLLAALYGLAPRRGVAPTRRAELGWSLVLATSAGLVVLAGDPRAVSSTAIAAGVALAALAARSRRSGTARPAGTARFVLVAAGSAALGLALAAVQWLPGISFLHGSQRGVSAYAFFGAGSLPGQELAGLLVLPFALGGNGNLGLPLYAGNYNLPEITVGVGLVALAAAFALLPDVVAPLAARAASRLGRRARPPGTTGRAALGEWYVILVVGVALTLGTTTPLGHLLVHIPLYSGERLQNRNAVLVDLALAVLLAVFLDGLLGRRAEPAHGTPPASPLGTGTRRALALAPVAWLAVLVVLALAAPATLDGLLGVVSPQIQLTRSLAAYDLATLGLGALLAAVVLTWSRLGRRAREVLLVAAVALDVVTYVANAAYPGVTGSLLASSTPLSSALASRLATAGRFAIFNPDYAATGNAPLAVDEVGVTDLNVLRHLASVQGYGSIVEGTYQDATDTHEFEALDQNQLAGLTFDSLDLEALLTLPTYLAGTLAPGAPIPVAGARAVTARGAPANLPDTPAVPANPTGPWRIAPGITRTWLLPSVATVVRVTVVVNEVDGTRPRRLVVGVAEPGAHPSEYDVPVRNGIAELLLPAARRAEEVAVRVPGRVPATIGAVVAVTRHPDERLLLDGALEGALDPPHWRYAGTIGPFVVFANSRSRGPAWLESPRATSPDAPVARGGSVTTGATADTGAETMHVVSSAPTLLVRSETFAPGWTARLVPDGGGGAIDEKVREIGLVQAIEVPAGSYTITWRYVPRDLLAGFALSALAALLLLALAVRALARRPRRPGAPPGATGAGDR